METKNPLFDSLFSWLNSSTPDLITRLNNQEQEKNTSSNPGLTSSSNPGLTPTQDQYKGPTARSSLNNFQGTPEPVEEIINRTTRDNTGATPSRFWEELGSKDVDEFQSNLTFLNALKKVENRQSVGRNDDGFWHPHSSLEGGTDTLGYGHKLTEREIKGGTIKLTNGVELNFKDGLSDAEVTSLLNDDFLKNKDRARRGWNEYSNSKSQFEDLPIEHQNILTNVVFNSGSLVNQSNGKFKWPKLQKSIEDNDSEGIRKNMLTWYTDTKGVKRPLKARANIIADAAGLAKKTRIAESN